MRTATLREYRRKPVVAQTHLEKGTYSDLQILVSKQYFRHTVSETLTGSDPPYGEIIAVLRDRALFVNKDAYSKYLLALPPAQEVLRSSEPGRQD